MWPVSVINTNSASTTSNRTSLAASFVTCPYLSQYPQHCDCRPLCPTINMRNWTRMIVVICNVAASKHLQKKDDTSASLYLEHTNSAWASAASACLLEELNQLTQQALAQQLSVALALSWPKQWLTHASLAIMGSRQLHIFCLMAAGEETSRDKCELWDTEAIWAYQTEICY